MYIDLHVKYPLFLSDFNETCIFATDFWKNIKNIKLHENPSSGRRVFAYRQTDGHDNAKNCFLQFCERAYKKRIFIKNQHLYSCLFSGIRINVIPYLMFIMLNRNDGFVIFIYRSHAIAFVASPVIYCL